MKMRQQKQGAYEYDQRMETFGWKRRTSSTGGQNTSQRFAMRIEKEVQKVLKNMKKGKVVGPDVTPFEMLTALGKFGIKK